MAKTKMRLLKRGSDTFKISAPMWANVLALALHFKWNPNGLSISYLAAGFHVSADEAKALSYAFDCIFEAALERPIDFYPVRVNMGELYLLKEFVEGGAFEVCDQ